jgi:molecular chaperone GrpE (heat shock protein)
MKVSFLIGLVYLTELDTQKYPLDLSTKRTNIDGLFSDTNSSQYTVEKINYDAIVKSNFTEFNYLERKSSETNHIEKKITENTFLEILEKIKILKRNFINLKFRSGGSIHKYENIISGHKYNFALPAGMNAIYTNVLFELLFVYQDCKLERKISYNIVKNPELYCERISSLRKELNKPIEINYREIGKEMILVLKRYAMETNTANKLIRDDIKLIEKLMDVIDNLKIYKLKMFECIAKIETLLRMIYPKLVEKIND